MTRKILVIGGIGLLALLLIFWGYLLVFGRPAAVDSVFTNLTGGAFTTKRDFVSTIDNTDNLAIRAGGLEQLTTRPVAGFIYYKETNASSTVDREIIRYAERGTGHIYEIDLTTNIETRLSNQTFSQLVEAVFSSDGEEVVLISEDADELDSKIFDIEENRVVDDLLPSNNKNYHWSADNRFLYYTNSSGGETIAYQYDSGTATEIWRRPLTEIDVYFRSSGDLVVNKPAPRLSGGIYEVSAGGLSSFKSGQYASTALIDQNSNRVLYGYFDLEERAFVTENFYDESLPTLLLPEKCGLDQDILICFGPLSSTVGNNRSFLNDWYKGVIGSYDFMTETDLNSGEISIRGSLLSESGQEIDVDNFRVENSGQLILFTNRNDNTLWRYQVETTPRLEVEEESSLETEIEISTEVNKH